MLLHMRSSEIMFYAQVPSQSTPCMVHQITTWSHLGTVQKVHDGHSCRTYTTGAVLVLCYLDDILITGLDDAEHFDYLWVFLVSNIKDCKNYMYRQSVLLFLYLSVHVVLIPMKLTYILKKMWTVDIYQTLRC